MPPERVSLFLSADQAEALAAWKSSESNVASLYLPADADGAHRDALDRLLRESAAAGEPGAARDLALIAAFVRESFVPGARRGLCVHSCVKYGVFAAFGSPEPFLPSLTVSRRPFLRPLNDARGRCYRFLSLQLDAENARFAEVHLGEAETIQTARGRFEGPRLAELAARAGDLFRARRADRLVVGGSPERFAALEPLLDHALQARLIHESLLGPERPLEEVVERIRFNEREAQKVREDVLVTHFLDSLTRGLAVSGLERVAERLQQGGVKRLLVRDGWAKMGRCCGSCGRLSVSHRSCPWCFRATAPVLDLVAELIDRAAAVGVEVFRVVADPRFDGAGRIGAELTSPAPAPAPVPAARALQARFALKDGRRSEFRLRAA
jgi:hypothetical protein